MRRYLFSALFHLLKVRSVDLEDGGRSIQFLHLNLHGSDLTMATIQRAVNTIRVEAEWSVLSESFPELVLLHL